MNLLAKNPENAEKLDLHFFEEIPWQKFPILLIANEASQPARNVHHLLTYYFNLYFNPFILSYLI